MALELADNDKYEVKEIIGRGAFGIIRKVRRKQDGHILCRKEINYLKMSQKERDQLHAEFSILASLSHPNIVGYFHREHLRQTQELYLYMEYCGGGDLGCVIKELRRKNEYAKEEFVWRIFSQLVTALYRCHYGIDPPEPGSDFSRQNDTRPLNKGKMILHRDLKPENIFLGDDQSVKLGDFGLSKIMQSHDFASTYVGTPFYMSPEICAAEKYTLYSDIWSLGCIMYELCTKEPPFNANSHLQLVQRIRKGDFKPIPSVYSKDLANVIANCLKTNPMHRPDTSSLLTVPYVWLSRRQQEMVTIGKTLKTREEIADYKVRQAEERLSALEADRAALKVEIDAQLRREWEVKARLEIDRQVQLELERLRKKFDREVDERVAHVLVKQKYSTEARALREIQNPPGRAFDKENLNPSSSVNTAGEEDFPSTTDITDLSDLSINSPTTSNTKPMPKKAKTPFARSKTTFDSPVDIQMSEPSPMSISSLALSPRRNAAAQATANPTVTAVGAKNLFAEAARQKARWEPQLAYSSDEENIEPPEDSDDDGFPELASPTRLKGNIANTDPFKNPAPLPLKNRPAMLRQNTTATMQKLIAKPTLFPSSNTGAQVRAGIASANIANAIKGIPRNTTDGDLRSAAVKATSPNRRLSKIPSRNDLREHAIAEEGSTSPLRRAATTAGRLPSKLGGGRDAVTGTGIGGRTLVELAQARAGGHLNTKAKTMPEQRSEKELPPVPVWDPEIFGDEMPSPFLKKDVKSVRVMR
ncbi:uncharacterized protein PV07_07039 [Cladophialophora immunda]|uniref:non-specific serine/threonine protein kinase n=1 Tax=Cladophialophora immunda TaxID=569365 RepID=A0A0D2AQ93_9EURO|nr:uncharacterized protein PV07_07039 [Cladophialophora immunda]KIW27287.1 hypothetical protein PV07_07039 [Cladophialophora immunda]OQV05858.1 Protein kinase domain-containing protein isoform 1 [Cladophialophora immunda]OQV05859.1 hypothetical protein CLAIMM_10520 isoform 2 [Cladophialophora immunda]OQV05860.1 Protein kinase domain-containing protein isoform 3 [Cladophialophora immunda]